MNGYQKRPHTAHAQLKPAQCQALAANTQIRKTNDHEIEKFLPRRSFYSCHERALKHGGYDPLTGRAVSVGNSKNRPQTAVAFNADTDSDSRVDRPLSAVGASYSLMKSSANCVSIASLMKKKNMKNKRSLDNQPLMTVDYSVLLNYLREVEKSESEYLSTRFMNTGDTQQRTARLSLITLGRLFREGHHGFGREENVVVSAAYEINPRLFNPSLLNMAVDNKTTSPSPTGTYQRTLVQDRDNTEDITSTELERCRSRLWRWLRTVNTVQIHSAREMALKELGLEEYTLSSWWQSNRMCRYLRDNSSLAATDDLLYQFI